MNTTNNIDDSNYMLTVQEVKSILRIDFNATYNLIHSKSFPVIRTGHSYGIPRDTFFAWAQTGQVASGKEIKK